jgi:ABC-2 type transport system ATP-binding protein
VNEAGAAVLGVSHRYATAEALCDVDLTVEPGVITALVGANGAGKTTLLRILAGQLLPSHGTARVLGRAPPFVGRVARTLRQRVGYIAQERALDPEMTGREILDLLAALYGVAARERSHRVADLATTFGIDDHLDRLVAQWSGGLKRRLHLAAGMIHRPALLALDEPTAGLDPEGRRFLWAELARAADGGCAVVVVTHDLAATRAHADTVAILERGTLHAVGPPEALAESLSALEGGRDKGSGGRS